MTAVWTLEKIGRREAMELAAAENAAFIAELEELSDEEWSAVTDCDPWTVKDVVSHVLGWGEIATSWREAGHQFTASITGWKEHGATVHAQNAIQVKDRAELGARPNSSSA